MLLAIDRSRSLLLVRTIFEPPSSSPVQEARANVRDASVIKWY
jgi:hypothetical protein